MEKAEDELQWRNDGDDEEEEEEEEDEVEDEVDADCLQVRKRQQAADNAATSPVSNGDYNGGGVVVTKSELINNGAESPADESSSEDRNEGEEEVIISTDGAEIGGDVEEMNGGGVGDERKSEYSVYFDKVEGIWKCRLCSWDFQRGSGLIDHIQYDKEHWHTLMNANTIDQQRPCFIHETEGVGFHYTSLEEQTRVECYAPKIPEDDIVDVTLDSFERGKGFISAINYEKEEHPKHEIVSASSVQSSEISFEELNSTSFKSSSNKALEVPDIDLIDEGDTEVTDFDVETLLKKQDTHDLFCPNCNSCITKRVILRKRKRRVRIAEEDAKRNKLESLTRSELDVISDDLTSDLAPDEVNLDENLPPAANDYDRDQGPDIFRCLSCFSFFIPKRDGRSHFWLFGDNGKKETLQDSPKIPAVKKNWFSSIFASTERAMSTEAGTGHRSDMNSVGAQRNPDDPKDQISSREEAPSHSAAGHGVDMQNKNVGAIDPSSQLDGPKSQVSSTQDDTTLGHYQADTLDELNSHINSRETPRSDKSDSETPSVSKPPLIIGDPLESPIASPQQDGLKLLIPSNVGSSVVEDSQKDQRINLSVEKEYADESTVLLSSTPASAKGESKIGGKVNNLVHFPSGNGHHVTAALALQTDPVIVEAENDKVKSKDGGYEVSLDHIVHQKVEIHLEKPPKSDKDAVISSIEDALLLHDGQNNLIKYPKHVPTETNAGKDTIITVEAEQVDTMPAGSQETTIVSSSNGASPQTNIAVGAVEGVGTTVRGFHSLEFVKSIVYGGLLESITSVGVVSSAVGAHAATLNVLVLGLANLFGGLFVIANDLWDLKNEHSGGGPSDQEAIQVDRYQALLGQREIFLLHSIVAVFSYLIFGLLPPVLYGFSFRTSNDENFKLLVVAGASIICIALLAAAKVYTQRPPKSYLKAVTYYITLGFLVSGAAYVAGNLINKFLEKLGLFPSSPSPPAPGTGLMEPTWGTLSLPGTGLTKPAWGSY